MKESIKVLIVEDDDDFAYLLHRNVLYWLVYVERRKRP